MLIKGIKIFFKRAKLFFTWRIEKDLSKLTEIEILIQEEVQRKRRARALMVYDCFLTPYSCFYYRTHTPEEVEERWRKDEEELDAILAEYLK